MKSLSVSFLRPILALSALFLMTACPPGVGNPDAGNPDSGGICSSDSDCTDPAFPVCESGVCSPGGGGCTADNECPSGSCNMLTGECEACTDCCSSDADCSGGWTCGATGHCEAPSSPCTTVNDCAVDQICSGGNCATWDVNAPCATNADCPRDHQCNSLGDARCEGCLNDAFCAASTHGPKCDMLDDGVGPGVGYCHPECGLGLPDCAIGFICDTDRGGLCVTACTTNADCQGGLVCRGGKCEACTTNAQCEATQICNAGSCVDNPGCSDAQCQASLGSAYFCDQATTSCRLGCTDSGCTGSVNECNPCPAGQTCDAISHQCSGGGGCTACPSDCSLTGQICDTVSCTCTSTGGGGGVGSTCLADADCNTGLMCSGALPDFGLPGTCAEGCSIDTFCICANPAKTCVVLGDPLLDMTMCLMGLPGQCQ
ncbi:MAG: hypothetical protein P1V51_12720 [Deltaproteobacteria bacterium]|nr:hypothetical protein [Deltaproteobacteria bacterium]